MKQWLVAVTILELLLASGCDSAQPPPPALTATIPAARATPTSSNRPTEEATAILASIRPTPSATSLPTGVSPTALTYLTYAVDYIQQHALNSDKVDWPTVRRQVFGPELVAQNTTDTYSAIEYVLKQLQDNHSRLLTPAQFAQEINTRAAALGFTASYAQRKVIKIEAGSLADRAGLRADDAIITLNDASVESLDATKFFAQLYFGSSIKLGLRRGDNQTVTAEIQHDPVDPTSLVHGRRLPGNLGYIALPALGATPVYTYYASIVQQIIENIDKPATCGWVVDLQGNTGGSMWPMLAGIGPVLGEGQVGSYIGPEGSTPWLYRNGQALLGDKAASWVDMPYQLQQSDPPVAVLTDEQTASAGEAVLVAFRGRPNTRSFGAATFGVPTTNTGVMLSDGADLLLAESKYADRTGHTYDDKIPPDRVVTPSAFWRGTDKDPVLEAGVAWLKQQPACANP